MKTQTTLSAQTKKKKGGFTLIEVIAVLVLLGILAAIALPRYIDMTNEARDRAIDAAISELTGRDALAWGQDMLATSGAATDVTVFGRMDTNLGGSYTWTVAPTVAGGTLQFQTGTAVALNRGTAGPAGPAVWTR